mmetsp:Transcript_11577/g.11108  ORF Transcript_11577/g.11108 Transcript_11577/m.11108 type:complete len:82 (-) Transcript_11577:1568-1813(-)
MLFLLSPSLSLSLEYAHCHVLENKTHSSIIISINIFISVSIIDSIRPSMTQVFLLLQLLVSKVCLIVLPCHNNSNRWMEDH